MTYCVSGTVLFTGYIVITKTDMVPVPVGETSLSPGPYHGTGAVTKRYLGCFRKAPKSWRIREGLPEKVIYKQGSER